MDEEYLRLTDEDGQEADFRLLRRFEVRGQTYVALADEEDEDSVILFAVTVDENGEETLCALQDDDECEDIFDYFVAEMDDYEFTDAE